MCLFKNLHKIIQAITCQINYHEKASVKRPFTQLAQIIIALHIQLSKPRFYQSDESIKQELEITHRNINDLRPMKISQEMLLSGL